MRRRELLLSLSGMLLLTVGAVLSRRDGISSREIIIDAGDCRIPVTILEPTRPAPVGSVVVLHGLAANRRAMDPFGTEFTNAGFRVFLPDLPGHGENSQSFSFPRAESCVANLLFYLKAHSEILPSRTIVVGHSMGGAIAIRVTERFAAAGTIAISPAPMSPMPAIPPQFLLYAMPRTLPHNLLVLRGGLEPPATAHADRDLISLAQHSGGEPSRASDDHGVLHDSRRAKWALIPFASHAGMLWDPRVFRQSIEWARESLQTNFSPPNVPASNGGLQMDVRALRAPAVGGALGFVGILCLFPAVATLIGNVLKSPTNYQERKPIGPARILSHVGLASILAVIILNFWIPLKALRIVSADYLGSFFLLLGLYLLLIFRGQSNKAVLGRWPSWLAGAVLSLAIVLGLGAWLSWRLDDAWMNGARWARWAPLVLACFPLCFAEELFLGPPDPHRRAVRLLIFGTSRVLAWVILVLAVFLLHSGEVLIVLLAIFLALFSIFQRFGMDAVRRRTASSGAAAIFGAILWAWFLAAVLPLT